MQAQRLGGEGISLTPNLDALAQTGARFDRAFCSNAQCVPSRASLQTGLYPHEAGVMIIYGFGGHTGHLGPEHTTVAHAFADAGYSTALFGKSHFGFPLSGLGYAEGIERGGGPSLAEVDQRISDDAISYIQEHDAEKPMFLVVSWHQPHPPFEDVDEFLPVALSAVQVPESFHDDLADRPAYQSARRSQAGGGYTEAELKKEQAQYLSMIAAVDHEVGRVLDEIGKRNRPTVIAFTSDHGDMMGAHGLRLKGPFPYEELYRVPLILTAPGVEAGKVINALNVNVELPGTLMDLAGVPRPLAWPERGPLTGLIDDKPGPEEIFMEHFGAYWGFHPFRMVRTERYKYVRHYGPGEGEEELYDLKADPNESHNKAHDPSYVNTRNDLRKTLERWWKRTGGRDWEFYESEIFKNSGSATLIRDNHLWADT
jgi:arylsulfatase A-like enzyme